MNFTRYRKNEMPLKMKIFFEPLSQRFIVYFLFMCSIFFCGVKSLSANEIFSGLETVGKPVPGGISFQPAVTELARDINWVDQMLFWIISGISIFVVLLLIYAAVKFNRKANPVPQTFTHHPVLEVTWTVVPIFILVFIGIFTLPMLYKQMEIPESDLTIKAVGNQWYWSYEYPEHEIEFDAIMLTKDELSEYGYSQDEYLLATDNPVVVPVGKIVRVQVTGADVIHAWKIPSFGVHTDAMPGRLNETWFKAEREGVYFGQCSELCGMNHAYMPIVVKVISQENFEKWLANASEEFASLDSEIMLAKAD